MRLLNPSISPDVNPCFTNPHTFSLCGLKPLASRWKGASLLADAMAHQFSKIEPAWSTRIIFEETLPVELQAATGFRCWRR